MFVFVPKSGSEPGGRLANRTLTPAHVMTHAFCVCAQIVQETAKGHLPRQPSSTGEHSESISAPVSMYYIAASQAQQTREQFSSESSRFWLPALDASAQQF
ncbi:hypothetical protein WJX77_004477 [Trebouxia sp. C0004]